MSVRAVLALVAALAACASFSRVAAAQTVDPERARAEQLFQEAKTLMADGRFREAYPLLVESQRVHPGGGTLLAIAMCHEATGRPATALAVYREALAQALRARRADRVALAEQHVAALESAVPRVVVRAPAGAPELVVALDGRALPRDVWSRGEPVDPGEHEIVATAAGAAPWRAAVDVPERGVATVEVPPSTPPRREPAPPPSWHVAPTPAAPVPLQRYAGWAAVALGGAGVAVGSYFGVQAFVKRDESRQHCEGTAPSSASGTSARVSPQVSSTGAGAELSVTFQ